MRKPTTLEAAYDAVIAEAKQIFLQRQAQYGPDNIRGMGVVGLACELINKGHRARRVAYNWELGYGPAPDKARDPWIDALNYAVIALMLRDGTWGLPLNSADDATEPVSVGTYDYAQARFHGWRATPAASGDSNVTTTPNYP